MDETRVRALPMEQRVQNLIANAAERGRELDEVRAREIVDLIDAEEDEEVPTSAPGGLSEEAIAAFRAANPLAMDWPAWREWRGESTVFVFKRTGPEWAIYRCDDDDLSWFLQMRKAALR